MYSANVFLHYLMSAVMLGIAVIYTIQPLTTSPKDGKLIVANIITGQVVNCVSEKRKAQACSVSDRH